ncbi:MAG: tRNA (adenosine(37)-N6)-dimethylallyltransferase MiaA [Candidatus Dormibacteria bacterium]
MVGPTAVGKTAVALELARQLDGELISFDSRQVYRGVEVSSNAPTAAEVGTTPVHLVSVMNPTEPVTAASYVAMVRRAAASARGPLVLTAGTGLYLKAYLDGLDLGGMGAVAGLRQQLEEEAKRDLPGLARRLRELSPELAERTDLANPVRVVRRMELLWAAALAEESRIDSPTNPPVDAIKIGLGRSAASLEAAIAARVEAMLLGGWREEVEALLALDPPACPQVAKSIGVAEMAAHIHGRASIEDTRTAVIVRTRQYAKRQRTWFRGDPQVTWVEVGNKTSSDIVADILEMIA